jgi:hypothetical protein
MITRPLRSRWRTPRTPREVLPVLGASVGTVEIRPIADDGGTRVGPGHGDPPVGQRPENVSG